jgi:NAD(P)-dependent dehydrogenase (short-subunit alcohol dehydrogenase family)
VTQLLIKRLVSNFSSVKFTSETESYASIIMLSSISKYGAPGASHYAMTKAGVDAFSKSIAKEYGAQRIRCNSVLPFVIETPMTRDLEMSDELKKALLAKTALNRFGKAEEVAQLIYFLASDASSYITGASIDINGGV